jgi:hypothetical protein
LTGRIQTPDGKGLRNGHITLIDSFGARRTILSGAPQQYEFGDLAVWQTVIVQFFSKRFVFPPQIIKVTDERAI